MSTALVGATGFVGGNLLRQAAFDATFRSTDIESIMGKSYDVLVCAGVRAEKWLANKEPENDRASIARLESCLAEVTAQHVVLMSTVDVYPTPVDVDEDSPIDPALASAYGRHRYQLERWMQQRFATTVVRLPGLFGQGIKKNVIYDLLHGNALDAMCPDSVFQFYNLDRIWRDVETARAAGIRVVNLATEPVSVRDVARVGFDIDFENPTATNAVRYDMRTKYDAAYGGRNGYIESREEVLGGIRAFVATSRAVRA